MLQLPYEITDPNEFRKFVSQNACFEYQKRFEAFLSGKALSKQLQEGLADIETFEDSTSEAFEKLMGKLAPPHC